MINTKDEIKLFQLVESKSQLSQNLSDKAKKGTVLHPTDSALNIVLISSHSVKLISILIAVAFALFVGKKGDYPDKEFGIRYKYKR